MAGIKMFWFPSKQSLKAYIQQELAEKPFYQEFTNFILTNLVWRHHYWFSKYNYLPTRFRKVHWENGEYRNSYRFEAYFPKLGEWRNLSWNKCIFGHDLSKNINAILRDSVNDHVALYKDFHQVCERCGISRSEEVDHVNPEFIVIQNAAWGFITEQDVQGWEEHVMNEERWDFTIPKDHPAIQYVIKAHETAILQAVCKPCHLLNAKERKASAK